MTRGRHNQVNIGMYADHLAAFNDELDDLVLEQAPLLQTAGNTEHQDGPSDDTPPTLLSTSRTRTASTAGLIERAEVIKRQCRLSSESEGKLDVFVQSLSLGPNTSSLLLAGYILEAIDKLTAQQRELQVEWKVPAIVETNAVSVARAFILSGHVASYRSNIVDVAYKFMSDKQLCPLPSELDTAQTGAIKGVLSTHLTRFRCDFKRFSTKSLLPDSDLENLGDLAMVLLGESSSQFTVSLAWRLALVRSFGGASRSEKVFWPAFDSYLAVLHSKPEHIVLAHLQQKLQEDQDAHGKIDTNTVTMVASTARSAFQIAIDQYALTVRRPAVARAAGSVPIPHPSTRNLRSASVSSSPLPGRDSGAQREHRRLSSSLTHPLPSPTRPSPSPTRPILPLPRMSLFAPRSNDEGGD